MKWLNIPAEEAAQRLLGCELVSIIDDQEVRARIVETEAYDQLDPASHSFSGRSARNDAMFKSAGHLYVYISYGLHFCCNIVCGPVGCGSAVLIRAVEPLSGRAAIEARRGKKGVSTTNGPGKVCQALGINLSLSGHDLSQEPVQLIQKPSLKAEQIVTATRIGISKNALALRRFYEKNNSYVSKKA